MRNVIVYLNCFIILRNIWNYILLRVLSVKYVIKGIFGRAYGNSILIVIILKKVELVRSKELGKKFIYVSIVRNNLIILDILKNIFENI